MLTIKLDDKLFLEIEKNISLFVGKMIDISEVSDALSSHLDVEWAKSVGVTQNEMSVQVAENHIRDLAAKANIEVVCLVRQQVENEPELIAQLCSSNRIMLFK